MSSKDRHLQTRGGAARRDKTRSGMVAALASLLVGTGGCGGSSNGKPGRFSDRRQPAIDAIDATD
jgi:hypothetical protein